MIRTPLTCTISVLKFQFEYGGIGLYHLISYEYATSQIARTVSSSVKHIECLLYMRYHKYSIRGQNRQAHNISVSFAKEGLVMPVLILAFIYVLLHVQFY